MSEQDDRADDRRQPRADVEELVERVGVEERAGEEAADDGADDADDRRDDEAARVVPGSSALAIAPQIRPRMMNAMIPMEPPFWLALACRRACVRPRCAKRAGLRLESGANRPEGESMEERFAELKERLADDPRSPSRARDALLGSDGDDAAGRGAVRAAQADDALHARPREVRRRRDRRAARRARAVAGAARLRLRRGVACPPARAATGTRRAASAPSSPREMTRAAAEGHDIWAKAREESDYSQFLPHLEHSVELKRRYIDVLRRLRRAVRRPARRLRAGDEDGRGTRRLRRAEAGARAADRRGRLGRGRRRVHGRPVADGRAARVLARDHRAVRLRPAASRGSTGPCIRSPPAPAPRTSA